jgi:putative MFS transporter
MIVKSSDELLALLDGARLTPRYWATTSLLMMQLVLELFDVFIVGFLVSVVAPLWHLTFGQSSIILLAVGLGVIAGSLTLGRLADKLGRKFSLVSGGLICALSAGAIAFVPDGNWPLFALLRFFVGFGNGGAAVSQTTLMVEFTPTRYRTLLSSITLVPAAGGIFLASLVSSTMLDTLGWRGIAALSATPVLVSLALWVVAPESVRWLQAQGRVEQARKTAASMLGIPLESIPLSVAKPRAARSVSLLDLLKERRRFWLVLLVYMGANVATTGCYLWGPIIVSQLLRISPRQAATQFIYVSIVGAIGRLGFSVLPHWLGRCRAGQIAAYGTTLAMLGAAVFHSSYLGSLPLFLIFLVGGALFWDGGWSAILPYAAEIFPVRMAARGAGLGQASGGVGKMIGPLVLAMVAGTNNLITPQATADAVLPGFLFLAACALTAGVTFTLIGVEPHGKVLSLTDVAESDAPG